MSMGNILIIAEKPALGAAIAEALPGEAVKKGGTIQKGNYTIVWAFGHLLTLKNPEDYDVKYKEWSLNHLPIYFPGWQMKVKKGGEERVAQIGKLLKGADMVIHAGDTDEEGQLLIDELLRWHGYQGEVKRLDTANTSVSAMKKALASLKENKPKEKNGWSAYGREVGDILFGYNLTRYYSVINKSRRPLSVGRVQTPTLGLLVQRDELIESHKKQKYYELYLDILLDGKKITVKFIPEEDAPYLTEGKVLERSSLEALQENFSKISNISEIKVEKEIVSEAAPLPFNLMKLSSYCAKKWGMNPDEVMKITQSLRDTYNAITYNRSDCQYLSEEHFKEAPEVLKACMKNLGISQEGIDYSRKSRCFNDANITAHFAIIPTTSVFDISRLDEKEWKVYQAICKYYMAQFMAPAKKEKTTLVLNHPSDGVFAASAIRLVEQGYRVLSEGENTEESKKEENLLCSIKESIYNGQAQEYTIKEKETQPPRRYTQDSLFADMGSIAKYVKDPEIKRILLEKDKEKKGENGSIGTVATRAMIIKRLIDVGYAEERTDKKKAYLISTKKGRAFYHMLPENIKGPDITAKWWLIQEEIKAGKASPETLAKSVLSEVQKVIASGEGLLPVELVESSGEEICKCPKCKGSMAEGKYGVYCKEKCGFYIGQAFGKKLTREQIVSLCAGKRILLSGLKKKDGSGTYSAYAVPQGVEEFTFGKEGEKKTGWQLKLKMEFPRRRK